MHTSSRSTRRRAKRGRGRPFCGDAGAGADPVQYPASGPWPARAISLYSRRRTPRHATTSPDRARSGTSVTRDIGSRSPAVGAARLALSHCDRARVPGHRRAPACCSHFSLSSLCHHQTLLLALVWGLAQTPQPPDRDTRQYTVQYNYPHPRRTQLF